MKHFICALGVVLFANFAWAACDDVGAVEKRECNKSKAEEPKCKKTVKDSIIEMLKKEAAPVMSACLKELQEFCGDSQFYKGCKIDSTDKTCTVWQMNANRTETLAKKSFPKEMDCMKKYKQYL